MKTGIAWTAFTGRGKILAEKLARTLGGTLRGKEEPLAPWAAARFSECEALVFVGAVGIAVRTVAPFLKSKAEDPAVVCVDELGRWAIPVLSGHLGGANELAARIAAITGGEAVITTATDVNGAFAVDLWAKRQGMTLRQPERIKQISSRILAGRDIAVRCPWQVEGPPPEHVILRETDPDVLVSCQLEDTSALQLIPRVLTLGVGCRRGMDEETLEVMFARFCGERNILPQAVEQAASIDLKQEEPGLLAFCRAHGWPLRCYTAEALRNTAGAFSPSAFVEKTVGVDNVCERAAVRASGGRLIEGKFARDGVTFALAERPAVYDWST